MAARALGVTIGTAACKSKYWFPVVKTMYLLTPLWFSRRRLQLKTTIQSCSQGCECHCASRTTLIILAALTQSLGSPQRGSIDGGPRNNACYISCRGQRNETRLHCRLSERLDYRGSCCCWRSHLYVQCSKLIVVFERSVC